MRLISLFTGRVHLLWLLCLYSPCLPAASLTRASYESNLKAFLDASHPNRSIAEKGHQRALDWIRNRFEKIAAHNPGARVVVHVFQPEIDFAAKSYEADFKSQIEGKFPADSPEYLKWRKFTDQSIQFVRSYRGKSGTNLVLELKGRSKPSEIVYLGAHYDTITHDPATLRFTPEKPTSGADDNGSGVAAILAIADALAGTPLERTVRIVAFDYEEVFFLGSRALAVESSKGKLPWAPASEHIVGLLNLEMIGWSRKSGTAGSIVKLYARRAPETGDLPLAQAFIRASQALKLQLQPVTLQNGFNRSDHWSFWQSGLPAVCITQDWEDDFDEKNYHTSHDDPRNLNLEYATAITRATAAAVKELAGADPATGKRSGSASPDAR